MLENDENTLISRRGWDGGGGGGGAIFDLLY